MLPVKTLTASPFRLLLLVPFLLSTLACRAAAPGDQSPSPEARASGSATAIDCRVPEAESGDARAQAAVGEAYKACFEKSGDPQYARQAADAYVRAAQTGLEKDKRILYTREIADLLVQLQDKTRLQKVFGPFLESGPASDQDDYYLALVDYADALARLGDDSAWEHFERAIEIHPQNNIEAINRYARHLIDRGQPEKAAEMLEKRLTKEQRIRFVRPAYLRQEALRRAGLDTAPADEEISAIEKRGGRSRGGASEATRNPGGRPGG